MCIVLSRIKGSMCMSRIKAGMLSREEEPLRQESTISVNSFCNKKVKDKKSREPHLPDTDCDTLNISKVTAT